MLYPVTVVFLISSLLGGVFVQGIAKNTTEVCRQLETAVSSVSEIYWPTDSEYAADIYHYSSSSSANATCSVEPGSPEDVGIVLRILGDNATPFAVKGGGHAMNPGFSSTTGVQIAMTRFSEIFYDPISESVKVGSGLIWDEVYAALEPENVTVVGGRVTGIGVAGFSLGGGYSWKTNQYGLTIDNIIAYKLVLPSGNVLSVSESSYPDLYFGLRGGYNNFGIVTEFTMKAWPQTAVWGGSVDIDGTYVEQVNAWTDYFANNVTDPKAEMIMTYNFAEGTLLLSALIFYDAHEPPSGIFDGLLSIPSVSNNLTTRSYLSLVRSFSPNSTINLRGYYQNIPVADVTPAILDVVVEQTTYYGNLSSEYSGFLVSLEVEPFLPDILTHGGPSAYPFNRAQRFLPFNLYTAWAKPEGDAGMYNLTTVLGNAITERAVAEGQDVLGAPMYPNYALYGTSLERLYGTNIPALQLLKTLYDPTNVMGLAGGWKV